jgi:putative hemolysin
MWQAIADRGKRRAEVSGRLAAGLAGQQEPKARSLALRFPMPSRDIEPKIYGRVGNLEVRLARTWSEIKLAQRLRYQVFFEEMSATPTRLAQFRRRDEDAYDAICDHLLVVDLDQTRPRRHVRPERPKVVGTYRILRQEVAERSLGFYSAAEYDIAPLLRAKSRDYRFMELGRSCVLAPYRSKRSVELLWHGLWTYVRENRIDVMIGCASFPGADADAHAMALSFLHHYAPAPDEWRCQAHASLRVAMDRLPKNAIDAKAALKAMPPLIKGYLRLGAFVGDGAVIDRQFGTTDVLVIMPVEKIDPRYFDHFGTPDETKSRIAADA